MTSQEGRITTINPEPAPGLFDSEGCIIRDVSCFSCGYNLRGLMFRGLCPECGQPITCSTRSDLLRFAPARWARGLARGLLLLLVLVPFWMILPMVVVLGVGELSSGLGAQYDIFLYGLLAERVVFAFLLIPLAYGVLLLARPDPRGCCMPPERHWSILARACVWALAILLAASLLLVLTLFGTPPAAFPVALYLFRSVGMLIAGCILPFVLLRLLHGYLLRVPARTARTVDVASIVPLSLAVLYTAEAYVILAFEWREDPERTVGELAQDLLWYAYPLWSCVALVAAGPIYVITVRVQRILARAARQARAFEQGEQPPTS